MENIVIKVENVSKSFKSYKDRALQLKDFVVFHNHNKPEKREILKNIFNEYKDSTILYISHRLQNKDLFDKTYELRKGIFYEKK